MKRVILLVLIGLILGLWEVAVLPFLPSFFAFRPILPCLVLILIASQLSNALIVAALSGLLIDIFTLGPLTFAAGRLLVTVLILHVIFQRLLTNRSLYTTIALVLIGRTVEQALAWMILRLSHLFGDATLVPVFDLSFVRLLIWDAGIVAIGFFLVVIFTNRFLTIVPRAQDFRIDRYGR